MTQQNVLIIGAGKRVVETALPAFRAAQPLYHIDGVFARAARSIDAAGAPLAVEALASLDAARIAAAKFIYVAVGKQSVPEVLQFLARGDVSNVTLLIDTPVLLLKHFRYYSLFRNFRAAFVAEDCSALPWFEAVDRLAARGDAGRLERAICIQSAYAYHAFAMLKTLFHCDRVARARAVAAAPPFVYRDIVFASGAGAFVLDPRDYSIGKFILTGAKGVIADHPQRVKNSFTLEPMSQNGRLRGFRVADIVTLLEDDEAALCSPGDPPSASVVYRMESMKRVGFLRLLKNLAAGRGAYPLDHGIEDSFIDYSLEKAGRYRSTFITNIRGAPGKLLFSLASRAAGR